MKEAAAYAKIAKETNPIYAKLAAGKAKNADNIALGDWLNAPIIWRIEWQPGRVRVRASDDVMVIGVSVAFLCETWQPFERGEAKLIHGLCWVYQAANSGRIRVEARDLPGNVRRQEFLPLPGPS